MIDPSPAGRGHPLRYNRDFRIAWTATFANNTGDWVLLVALPVFVFIETGSGASTAILFIAQLVVGAIVGPVAGTLVDRWNLRRCLIATNLAQAVTVLPLLAVTADRVWPAYVVMAIQSALTRINDPANVAIVPRVVATGELTTANAALAAAESLARLIGAPLGGLLVAVGGLAPVVIVDAASFVLVAVGLRFLRADTDPVPPDGDEPRGVRDGLRTVRSHRPLTALLGIQAFSQVAQGAFVVLFVVFVVETLGDDGTQLGVIRGTMAIGALAGSLLIARLARRSPPTVLFAVGLIGMGAVSLLFWNAPTITTTFWLYPLLFALSGLPGAALSVGLLTTIQTTSPSAAIGRVTGVLGAGEAIGVAAGSIVAGLLVDLIDLRLLLNGQAAVYLAAGGLALLLVAPHRASGSR